MGVWVKIDQVVFECLKGSKGREPLQQWAQGDDDDDDDLDACDDEFCSCGQLDPSTEKKWGQRGRKVFFFFFQPRTNGKMNPKEQK